MVRPFTHRRAWSVRSLLLPALALISVACAPPVVPAPPTDTVEKPVSCGALSRCDRTCADLQKDPLNCGACARSCVIPNATAGCQAARCTIAACNDGYYDSDGRIENGCEANSQCIDASSCQTSCGSTGSVRCSGAMSTCEPPAETCNAQDDNCNGACDEGSLPGCRIGVHRSVGKGHFYTTDQTAAMTPPFTLEAANYFYVYSGNAVGLRGFYLCPKGAGTYFLTTSATCEVLGVPGMLLGYVATDARCGAIALHRLYHPMSDDHFYTTSAAERDNAVTSYGYQSEGIGAFVFPTP